jgi:hypothetical protein
MHKQPTQIKYEPSCKQRWEMQMAGTMYWGFVNTMLHKMCRIQMFHKKWGAFLY